MSSSFQLLSLSINCLICTKDLILKTRCWYNNHLYYIICLYLSVLKVTASLNGNFSISQVFSCSGIECTSQYNGRIKAEPLRPSGHSRRSNMKVKAALGILALIACTVGYSQANTVKTCSSCYGINCQRTTLNETKTCLDSLDYCVTIYDQCG